MTEREQVLEAVLKELIASLKEKGCPYCWRKQGAESSGRAEDALSAAEQALDSTHKPQVRVFGKRREGLDRSEITHHGRYEES